jgi:hypothetical protein
MRERNLGEELAAKWHIYAKINYLYRGGRMSQPDSNIGEASKLKKLLDGNVDESSITARTPRINRMNVRKGPPPSTPEPASSAPEVDTKPARLKFLPALWTFASVLSLAVNAILIAVLLIMLQMLGAIQLTANDQVSGLLGGLYTNFVKMDQATISANIPVDAVIPLNIVVPVQATTRITLAENVSIPNAHVRINTGTLNIDADATVTLPANTPLMVNLDFPLTVQNSIPVHLDVPVTIPLKQTELHEPFVGLQKVVEPFYCLVEPNAVINNINICSPTANFQNTQEPVSP